jgi:hypothetical protein
MSPVDEKAAKLVPTERPSAGAPTGSIDKLDEQLRVSVDALRHLSPPPTPELDDLLSAISHHLDEEASERKAIRNRLLSMQSEMERLALRGFRYLVATCIVVAAILAWQSYGDEAKQIIATRVPELGWSSQTKQMKPPVVESKAVPVTHTAPETVAPKVPSAPSPDPVQAQQMVQSLAALRESVEQLAARQESLAALGQTVDRLAAGQDQMVHQIDVLQSANQEILAKIPAPPTPPPAASAHKHPARKPAPFWSR